MEIKSFSMCISFLATFLFASLVHAIPTYVYESGQIAGVNGLEVDGKTWNVTWRETPFSSSEESFATLYSTDFSYRSSEALLQFFNIDREEVMNAGFANCSGFAPNEPNLCQIHTAYIWRPGVPPGEEIQGYLSSNFVLAIWDDERIITTFYHDNWQAIEPTYVNTWATWTEVPEPPALLLMGLALLVLGMTKRKALS